MNNSQDAPQPKLDIHDVPLEKSPPKQSKQKGTSKKTHSTRKQARKSTSLTQPESNSTTPNTSQQESYGMSLIQTNQWKGLLCYQMAPGGIVIMESGFRGLLSTVTRLISKVKAHWLHEHYDPWETLLHLPNDKLFIYDEDVHATLGLLMGSFQIQNLKNAEDETA